MLTTYLWIRQVWHDAYLKWDKEDYDDLEMINIPSDLVWKPDIVLYNKSVTRDRYRTEKNEREHRRIEKDKDGTSQCSHNAAVCVCHNASTNVFFALYALCRADEESAGSSSTNVKLRYNGEIVWDSPAITKSTCVVDVSYFPFDWQQCNLTFGSWTYNGNQVCSSRRG